MPVSMSYESGNTDYVLLEDEGEKHTSSMVT